jgi:hypothetical protein
VQATQSFGGGLDKTPGGFGREFGSPKRQLTGRAFAAQRKQPATFGFVKQTFDETSAELAEAVELIDGRRPKKDAEATIAAKAGNNGLACPGHFQLDAFDQRGRFGQQVFAVVLLLCHALSKIDSP